MKRRLSKILFCFFLLMSAPRLSAQESLLSSWERDFIRAGLPGKKDVLAAAAADERAGDFIGDLYEFAFQFALNYAELFRDDPDMIALVTAAAKGAGEADGRKSITSMWRLFELFHDSNPRVEIINAMAVLGKNDPVVIGKLNGFLEEQNNSFRAGVTPDMRTLRACIAALGALGDNSSFPVLFSAMTASYPQSIIQETLKALDVINGVNKIFLIGIIRNNPFPEKAAAFRIGAYNERLGREERGELAQAALDASIHAAASSPADQRAAASLRYDAITVLTRLRWTPAASLAIRNYYLVQTDYASGAAPKERLLEAIACLGVMSSSEAAHALTLQLGFLNSRTEREGEYDEALVLAIINALGELGDKSAFDYLLYVSYLNYPDRIQASARDALNRLRW